MDVSVNKLFLFDEVHQLLLNDGRFTCIDMDSGPMNRKPIKAHKGVDNTLKFRVLGPDRKPVNICSYQMYARIINCDNNELYVEKLCRIGSATGMVFLDLNEGDLADTSPGLHHLILVGQQDFVPQEPGDYTATPFFTDFDSNVSFTLDITNQSQRNPVPSVTIEDTDWTPQRWLKDGVGPLLRTYTTESIPTGRVRNHTNSTQTFSLYSEEELNGQLELLGTLELTPNPDPDGAGWFRVMLTSADDVLQFSEFTGTEAFSYSANIMWLKFRYTPEDNINQTGLSSGEEDTDIIPKKIIVRS